MATFLQAGMRNHSFFRGLAALEPMLIAAIPVQGFDQSTILSGSNGSENAFSIISLQRGRNWARNAKCSSLVHVTHLYSCVYRMGWCRI
jgi:hypothetical protein